MKKKGFTLVEMAIVLIVIGLLAGAVLVGRTLLGSTRVQTLVKDVQQYQIMIRDFKETYGYFPGDLPNAYATFNIATLGGCTNNIKTGAPFAHDGCNGDGNGMISYTTPAEGDLVFMHLGMSGISKKKYENFQTSGFYVIGKNVPAAPWDGSFYRVDGGDGATVAYVFSLTRLDPFNPSFVSDQTGASTFNQKVMTPGDAYKIDTKMDDGNPSTGMVGSGYTYYTSKCLSSSTAYNLTTTDEECATVIRIPLAGF